ncbi:hypothetical protein [Psychroserpens sp.]|uniref:hypothetical protein n=1 Tax=Psychroserpens sp. TaxID=2020870 RepID=UPI001B00590D|nr:hypothetical protein [Psychroserpens sp.]MBO6606288.1 hypothetical protein [Psychroserpens sp.]MBO6631367.1 hypothetical protein [Psychroserpens sp.]MBO6652992.1 hypothetical protein [Psychroserpens sp.]MBO6680981.1 hypothetical protein [Psychroserpens sp.]MBO6750063.1 hypothetical protein [Psychroserpens sp.]
MRQIAIILTFISAAILRSCSYSETKNERFNRAITEFNKKVKSIELNNYYPNSYTEVKTDSIIANTFDVRIKTFSAATGYILIETTTNNHLTEQLFHKDFYSEIKVHVSDRIVYQKQLKASLFDRASDPIFWDNATLEHVWIDQWSSNTNSLALHVSLMNPLENTFKLYEIRIDRLGNETMRLINQNS